jgi:hypothetical protein
MMSNHAAPNAPHRMGPAYVAGQQVQNFAPQQLPIGNIPNRFAPFVNATGQAQSLLPVEFKYFIISIVSYTIVIMFVFT